ncbi:hypothetical protein TTHERM_000554309 (macronuclear) [Tetrahymena thermophila SB210]|uniref:Uncharacterized protein n=1 Tax=Tetrahymena thermophila (strain SB210) TaxID=312017 RepID=W7XJZ6_TETTS|nr:hypothetical protein TTHERM_000554309 [Tetrahymena thermophila SB210]EWS76086.1 hypothetical protein TTHERM_000554309 [Tetrahymena thermophila SB210]|eukprot:XP_012651393.1 hypothetical protein TTHERM_000554309 [Tetrahymena thermophila SB210]
MSYFIVFCFFNQQEILFYKVQYGHFLSTVLSRKSSQFSFGISQSMIYFQLLQLIEQRRALNIQYLLTFLLLLQIYLEALRTSAGQYNIKYLFLKISMYIFLRPNRRKAELKIIVSRTRVLRIKFLIESYQISGRRLFVSTLIMIIKKINDQLIQLSVLYKKQQQKSFYSFTNLLYYN